MAGLVHDLRTQAGLTQKELAARIGTTPSVISRLEDADYGGHSLSMLRRIAAAVGPSGPDPLRSRQARGSTPGRESAWP